MGIEHISESPNLGNMSGYSDNMTDEMSSYEHMYATNSSSHCESPEMIVPETSGMMVSMKRRYSDDEEDIPQDMPSSSRKRSLQRFDETEMFFLSMSETVKRLRPVDQARVKKELCNLVYEAEIKLLQETEEMEDRS